MILSAAATLPLWASIVIAVAAPAVAVAALILGRKQQAATLEQQNAQQARTLDHERQRDDLREVRSVLDDAARALADAENRWRAMFDDPNEELTHSGRPALFQAGHRLEELKLRIAIRFGREHEVTSAFDECADSVLDAGSRPWRERHSNRQVSTSSTRGEGSWTRRRLALVWSLPPRPTEPPRGAPSLARV
jgi:hypothetical protein